MTFLSAVLVAVCGVGVGACDSDVERSRPTATAPVATPTEPSSATSTPITASTTSPTAPAATSTSVPASSSVPASTAPTVGQVAVWPAPGHGAGTPEQAAADFVAEVLDVSPRLGPFRAGDTRSGEIEVLAPPETDNGRPPTVRSVLILRQFESGWFVIAAVSAGVELSAPAQGAEVAAGPLTVSGTGRGFEALVVVEAFVAGERAAIAQVLAQGGSAEALAPFEVELDLAAAAPGQTVVVVARGGVGLEDDPGEFSAIPLVVAG